LKLFVVSYTQVAYAIMMMRRFKFLKHSLQSMIVCEE